MTRNMLSTAVAHDRTRVRGRKPSRGVFTLAKATATATAMALVLAASAQVAVVDAASVITGAVSPYEISSPDIGSCRLKGIAKDSANFKYYASVSAKDVDMNHACGRCIRVSKEGSDTSVTAFVLDVCDGCEAGTAKLSAKMLKDLSIDANANNAQVSYKFTTCPSDMMQGNVQACLMEGASNSYIPLQFYNSQKVIASVKINGLAATQNSNSFFFFASPQQGKETGSKWYEDVKVEMTSTDKETQSSSFAFGGSTGCATSDVQFSTASTAYGDDTGVAGAAGGGSNVGMIVGVVIGAVAALVLVIGSIFFVRRRRALHNDPESPDLENQYLSPRSKPAPAAYAVTGSHHDDDHSTDGPTDDPASPGADFAPAATPPASAASSASGHSSVLSSAPSSSMERASSAAMTAAATPSQSPSERPSTTYSAAPMYSYSKPVELERKPSMTLRASGRQAPTFAAPVVPSRALSSSDEEEQVSEGRSSFDIDDLRETEVIREQERMSSFRNTSSSYAPQSSESAYAANAVTSPQSYVRATSLRRQTNKQPSSARDSTARSLQANSFLSDASERDSYASGAAPPSFNQSLTGSFRDSNTQSGSGYSQNSLGILGYPYARKSGSQRGSLTGASPY